jgi:hypothetical protein
MSVISIARSASVGITRRQVQIVLGLFWLLDGVLQLQPFMFGTGFATQVIAPTGNGQPIVVAGPVHWVASIIAAHPLPWGIAFAAVQLLIGIGLLIPRTARVALAVSIVWAAGVWYLGEGLSGLASGHVSLLNGAPGSALFYGVLGVAAWPHRDRSHEPPARWLPLAWAVLWIGAAVFQALPGQNTGTALAALTSGGSGPGWLNGLDTSVSGWIVDHGLAAVIGLVAAEALIGLGVLYRRTFAVATAAGFVLIVAIWLVGQDLGALNSGQSTDPNSGAIVAAMAIVLFRGRHWFESAATVPALERRRVKSNVGFTPVPATSGAMRMTRRDA